MFKTVKIVSLSPKTPSSIHLEVKPDPKILKSYRVPGQYVAIRLAGFKEAFFALSNPPGEKTFSFLVKKSSPLAQRLAALKKGDVVDISEIRGKGFAMDRVWGKSVFLLAVGSAIGPIRAALAHILKKPSKVKLVSLYFGALNAGEFAYAEEFPEWEKKGATIIQTVFPPNSSWNGPTGFVQDHLPQKLPADAVALICGMQEMLDASRARLKERGLSDEMILTNI
ncbi:MAG: NAD-binding oxidoreductase [Deltaproteobacteria bacterium]|nr:NAD-binding oxidoreductase [Deltaproteobacteria bacterium]